MRLYPKMVYIGISIKVFVVGFVLWGVVACVPNPEAQTLTIFAASSLTDVLPVIGEGFREQVPGVAIIYNFSGSSTLAAQINEGAKPDVFLSANIAQMDAVQEHIVDASIIFVRNKLVVAIPAMNSANIQTLQDLTQPGVKIITASEGVPVRTYMDAMLMNLGDFPTDVFYNNIVSEEPNVRQVLSKVVLGEVDAAIVYQSDVTPQTAADVLALDIIPSDANVIASYPAAILQTGQVQLAAQFLDYLQTEDTQAIFTRWGFLSIYE